MSPSNSKHDFGLADALLDDALRADERRKGEQQVAADARLGRYVDLQRKIVRQMNLDLDPEAFKQRVAARLKAHRQSSRQQRLRKFVGIGAAVAAAIGLIFFSGMFFAQRGERPELPVTPPEVFYQHLVQRGFNPSWPCGVKDFPAKMQAVFGHTLVTASLPQDVELLGWSYARIPSGYVLSEESVALFARVRQQEVIVLIDWARNDRGLASTASAGINVFRRELDAFVLYELTPLAEARLLPLIVAPPMSMPIDSPFDPSRCTKCHAFPR